MQPVHGTTTSNDQVGSRSYSHSPYKHFINSEGASPPYPINQVEHNSGTISFSQCNSPHTSTYATTTGYHTVNPDPDDAEPTLSPMGRVGSVSMRVTGPLKVNARHHRCARSPHIAGSNCSENANRGPSSPFLSHFMSSSAPDLQSSRAQEDAGGFVGSFSNGDPVHSLSHSCRQAMPGGSLISSLPAYDYDESSRGIEMAMIPSPHYGLPQPQTNAHGYPPPPPPLQSHLYGPSGFVTQNLLSMPTQGMGSSTLSSHKGWMPANSHHSESDFSSVPNIGSVPHAKISATSQQNSYYNRCFSTQSNALQQALGPGAMHVGRGSSEALPALTSEDVTTPITVSRKSRFPDESDTCSSESGGTVGSIREDLPLCPKDELCPRINKRKHQYRYAHTCRLFPCYHGHVARHTRLFRHVEGQIAHTAGFDASRMSVHTLASVNFSQISLEAPNAYRIYVSHGNRSHEIFGDWASVRIHTFKRYLHQVYHIPPSSLKLVLVKTGKVLDDEIATVKSYDVDENAVLQLLDTSRTSGHQTSRIPFDEL